MLQFLCENLSLSNLGSKVNSSIKISAANKFYAVLSEQLRDKYGERGKMLRLQVNRTQ